MCNTKILWQPQAQCWCSHVSDRHLNCSERYTKHMKINLWSNEVASLWELNSRYSGQTRTRFAWELQLLPAFMTAKFHSLLTRVFARLLTESSQITPTLMQLLFTFDRDTRAEKTLMQTPVCQLLSTHATLLVWPGQESWENSHANSHLPTLINSHATLVLDWLHGTRELRKLSCERSLANSNQLSCNSCSRLTGTRELRKVWSKI